jgi:hypothetical protein
VRTTTPGGEHTNSAAPTRQDRNYPLPLTLAENASGGRQMTLVLIIVLLILLFGGGGYYGYRSGYYGSTGFGGILGLLVVILILYLVLGGGYVRGPAVP